MSTNRAPSGRDRPAGAGILAVLLEKLEQIVVDKTFPIEGKPSVPLEDFPPQVLEPIKNYLQNLPGYNPKKKGNQESEVREQHGFITKLFGPVVRILSIKGNYKSG